MEMWNKASRLFCWDRGIWPTGITTFGAIFAVLIMFPTRISAAEGCILSGRVIDESGVPVASAAVSALRGAVFIDGLGERIPVSGAAADSRGEYCIRGLPPGKYIVRAVARTHPPSASPECDTGCGSSLTEFQTTFYRASLSKEHATVIEVTKGKNAAGIDIMMRRVRAYCLRGEVRDGNGALRADVAVGVETDSWSAGVITEGGRFLLTSLPADTYTIVIRNRPQLGHVLARRVIRVPAGTPPLVIRIPSLSH